MLSKIIFSERLNKLRAEKAITLLQLGEAVGLTKAAVGNLTNGNKGPSADTLIALADFFNVSLDYLVGRSDEPKRR